MRSAWPSTTFDVDLSTLKIGDGDTPYDELKSFRTDTVLYSEQDLDEEEKIVARKNIDAEPIYGGLRKKTITYKGILNKMFSVDVYIEKGDIIQPPDDASDDDITTFGYFMTFCIGSMISSNFESYQRSCQHAVTVWKAGYITTDLVVYTEPDKKNKFAFWLMSESNSQYGIERKIPSSLAK